MSAYFDNAFGEVITCVANFNEVWGIYYAVLLFKVLA